MRGVENTKKESPLTSILSPVPGARKILHSSTVLRAVVRGAKMNCHGLLVGIHMLNQGFKNLP
jgi:hypothetical protein